MLRPNLMHSRLLPAFAATALFATVSLCSASARADGPVAQPLPPPAQRESAPQGYRVETVQSPGYTAPLAQTTQPSYVPQSIALSGPREIRDYSEGEPVPPGYRPVERTRTGLIVGGAVTFGCLYFISALVAAGNADANSGSSNPAAALWVPGIGPFIQMTKTDSSTANVFLAIDGVAQSAGLAMFIVGLTVPRTVLVRNDLLGKSPKLQLQAVPLVARDMSGAGVVGTF